MDPEVQPRSKNRSKERCNQHKVRASQSLDDQTNSFLLSLCLWKHIRAHWDFLNMSSAIKVGEDFGTYDI